MRFSWVLTGLVAVLLNACDGGCQRKVSDWTPDEVLRHYLELSLSIERLEQKQELMQWTTGDLRSALAGTDDDTFRAAYIERKFVIDEFVIVRRNDLTPRESEVTYRLKFREKIPGQDLAAATVVKLENTVLLVRQKIWQIDEVVGSRTSFDFAVSAENTLTARPAAP